MGTTIISATATTTTLPPLLPLLLLPLIFFVVFGEFTIVSATAETLNYTSHSGKVSSLRLQRIQRHLSKINKPPVLSVQSPDGDTIDCVRQRKQPALDHPLLKNHKIQRAPSEWPKLRTSKEEDAEEILNKNYDNNNNNGNRSSEEGAMGAWQMWHDTLVRCPKGTIPVRRSSVHDVLRAKSLFHFGRKKGRRTENPLPRRTDKPGPPDVVSGNGHEHAIAYTGASTAVYGAKATINVWDPSIQVVNEFSLSQIWLLSGSFDGSDLNSIEAGWQVLLLYISLYSLPGTRFRSRSPIHYGSLHSCRE